jgi:hypothetical protein
MTKSKTQARCDHCRFWKLGLDKRPHPDDWMGECRRHAPAAGLLIIRDIGQLLGQLVWAIEQQLHIEHKDDDVYLLEDCSPNWVTWPQTTGSDCCGDFEPRRRR